ncbi:MAG: hypothetical protein IPJ49_04830 [Candidatus Obscuribacter sp.]|nr:hypothetical protein [Candidatus Obscuribacter sp.]
MFHLKPTKHRALSLLLGALALSSQLSLTDAAMAISLPTSGKKPNFHLPAADKLDDSVTESDTTADSTTGSTEADKPLDLSSIKLGDDKAKSDTPSEEGTLKTGATINQFEPKGPMGEGTTGLPSTSIKLGEGKDDKADKKDKKDKKDSKTAALGKGDVKDTAKAVNAQPLALINSNEELNEKSELLDNSEKKQIADLWDATLERSPDIQFVVQKLVPTSDKGHATHIMMKMLSSVMYGAVGSMAMVSPTQGTYVAQNFAASLLGQLNGTLDKKQLAKMSLTQGEIISLYNMVRTTADRLVDQYRCYKKFTVSMDRAATDLEDLRNMAKDARVGQDAAKQLEMEYTLRKAQRDIDEKVEDVHRYRQNLMDIAGPEAIAKLDTQIKSEMQQLDDTKLQTDHVLQLAQPGPNPI